MGRRGRRLAPPSPLAVAAVAIAIAAVAVTWRRLFFGVDLSDEGFSVALAYRMVLGAKPFVDEINPLQTAQFFVFPFAKVYVWLAGGSSGIVLFARHLYLAWVVAVAAVCWLGFRRVVRWEHALAAALVCVTFVFVSTTDLTYNTLGAGFLAVGMALGVRAVAGEGRPRWLAAAGVAQALAVLAYPPMIVVLPVMAACAAWSLPGRRRAALRAWCAGAGTTLLAEALLLLSFGASNLVRSAHDDLVGWGRLNSVTGPAKLWSLVTGLTGFVELYPLVVVAALLVWLVYRRRPVARLALLLAPLALLPFGEHLSAGGADGFGVVYGVAAPYFYLFVPPGQRLVARRLLVWCYVPALAAGVVSGYSSANGWIQMDVGLLSAMVLSGVYLALALAPRDGEGERLRRALPGLALACLAGVVAATLVYQFQFLPRAVPYSQMTVTLRAGPWAGIRTTPQRAAYLEQLQSDLSTVARPSDRILFFYQAPAFYLLWPHRVATDTVWLVSPKGLEINGDTGPLPRSTLAYYRRRHVLPDVVVRLIDTTGLSASQLERDYCGGLHYRLVLVRPRYAVFRRPADVTTLAAALQAPR